MRVLFGMYGMNNNTLAGILIGGVVILGGGYLLLRNNDTNSPPAVNTNNNGTGTNSGSGTKTPPAPQTKEAPTVETGASTFVSSSTSIVSGRVRPNGASTTYWFEYGETTALGSRTTTQNVGSSYSFISAPGYITGLQANTVYYYRLSAKNSFATVNGATSTFQTNSNPPVPGSAPSVSTTSASSLSRTSANLNGQVDPNGWQTNYWFEYGKDINLGSVTALQGAGSGDARTNVSISATGLEAATRYYFRLNAQNQYGTANGSIMNFTTSGPANADAPSVTTNPATNITTTGATLNGRIDPNKAETSYWFEYSQDSLLGSLIGSTSPMQTLGAGSGPSNVSRNINGLSRDSKYYYRLVGRNSEGTVYGSILSFTSAN